MELRLTDVNLGNLNLFYQALLSALHTYDTSLIIDLGNIKFCEPEHYAYLALILKEFKRRKTFVAQLKLGSKNNVISYLSHIGFFDFIDFKYGKSIGIAKGSDTYIPIRKISESELFFKYSDFKSTLQDYIVEESESLTRLLLKSSERTENYQIISYSIREAIRNALEHSNESSCYICAQRWANGKAQIVIFDEGIGIFNSLKNAEIIGLSEENCLSLAIQPGVSKTNNIPASQNIHDNSGYGLYALYQIARNYGKLLICSSNKYLCTNKNFKQFDEIGKSYNRGTLLALTFENYPSSARYLLKDIMDSGEDEAKLAGRSEPSSRSKNL